MGTNIIIVAISSVTAIVVAAFTYYTTKQREREAEWRREKLAHGLFASQKVIKCLHASQEVTRLPYDEVVPAEHDRA